MPEGCNCRSHNREVGERPEVLLDAPEWVKAERVAWFEDPDDVARPVSIDACIAPAVEALWAAGHITLGSCCGHGAKGDGPSLVLGNDERNYAAVRRVIATVDSRQFQFMQWQLVEAGRLGEKADNAEPV